MTIEEIQSNEELRRREFPVTRERVFLAHAAVCALPRRVTDAVKNAAEKGVAGDQELAVPLAQLQRARQTGAKLLGAQPEEIAFVGPTSLALSFVAGGLRWRKGDNVLIYFDDYPSNVYPWMALAERGVEVRLLNIKEYGRIRNIDVLGQTDEQTRLVALASNHFVAGYRIDLAAIGAELRKRNILFCVDGIQTLGAFPTEAKHFDFLAADAHKWLLGPCGAGIFYVRKSAQEWLKPMVFGWHNVRCADFVAQEQMTHPPDARRYEAGSANLLGLVGLQASMELLLEVGIDNIGNELLRKRAWLVPALQKKGFTVLQAEASPANASGITSFYRPGADMAALHKALLDAGIETSLRVDRAGQKYIRISPHFYNTADELNRTLEKIV